MDEMSEMQRADQGMAEGSEHHRSRGWWGVVAAVAAAVIGSVFAMRRMRSTQGGRTPMTMA